MKQIQVFTKNEEIAEISGLLVNIKYTNQGIKIQHKEAGFNEVLEHYFPYWNIKMIRISKYER